MMQAVLEMDPLEGFGLWPVAETERFGFLALGGGLSLDEVGAAILRIAAYNDADPEANELPPRPADPLAEFLHGLLHLDPLLVPGGLRVTDTATGATFEPGCCDGLEDRREWERVVDGDGIFRSAHPESGRGATRIGDTVRLTCATGQEAGPVIEVPLGQMRRLLAGVERDLTDFLALADDWASRYAVDHVAGVTASLGRLFDLPVPGPSVAGRPVTGPSVAGRSVPGGPSLGLPAPQCRDEAPPVSS
ncbi:hypothetical protein [Streptomyces sp. NPDC002690]